MKSSMGFVSAAVAFLLSVGIVAGCSPSSGGTKGSGGSSGSGGSGPVCTASEDDLISDFTMDSGVHKVDGRQGGWYTYGDRSGVGLLAPAEGGSASPDMTTGNSNCSGAGAFRVKSLGFEDWGSAFGTDIMPSITTDAGLSAKGTYDASKYRGVAFWAKGSHLDADGNPDGPIKRLQVKFTDPWTEIPSVLPVVERCQYMSGVPNNCSPYIVKFGYGYTGADIDNNKSDYPSYANLQVDSTWRRFEIIFAETKQDRNNAGQKSPGDKLNASQLMGMAIQVNTDHSTSPPTKNDYEIWIDDVSFIK